MGSRVSNAGWITAVALVFAGVLGACADASTTSAATDASTATTTIVEAASGSPTTVTTTTRPAGDLIVTVAGTVTGMFPGGDLALKDRGVDYTITMSASPSVTDVNGAALTADVIRTGESVQVIGTVDDKTIVAQSVIVPAQPPPSQTVAST